jgi:CRP-like cAMP-binding protein
MNPDAISAIGLLTDFSTEDLDALAECATIIRYRKGDDIIHEGQPNGALFVVQSGLLHVRRKVQSSHTLLGRLEPGSFFGEISVFHPGPTTATIHAMTDGVLLRLEGANLRAFIERCPTAGASLLRRILEEMAARLRAADERMTEAIVWGGLLRA